MAYFEDILDVAHNAGFNELGLLVNPQSRIVDHLVALPR